MCCNVGCCCCHLIKLCLELGRLSLLLDSAFGLLGAEEVRPCPLIARRLVHDAMQQQR